MIVDKKEDEIAKERKEIDGHLKHVISVALKNLHNPTHLHSFVQDLNQLGEPDLALKNGEFCFKRVKVMGERCQSNDFIGTQ